MVPAMFALGQIAEQKGDFQSAMASYRDVAERDTNRVDVRVKLGSILLAGKQLDQATKYADEAYALAPTDPDVLSLKAAWRSISAIPPAPSISPSRRSKPSRANSTHCWSSPPNACAPTTPQGALALLNQATDKSQQQRRFPALQADGLSGAEGRRRR